MSAEGVEVVYQQMSEAEIGFHFLPIFCNFTPLNRNLCVTIDVVSASLWKYYKTRYFIS